MAFPVYLFFVRLLTDGEGGRVCRRRYPTSRKKHFPQNQGHQRQGDPDGLVASFEGVKPQHRADT